MAPSGTASFSGPSAFARLMPATPLSTALAASRFLLHLGDVDALQVKSEASRRQVGTEALEQAVVAAAAAEHVPERRIVDLEDGAAVVAEVAQQAEVDLHAAGDAARLQCLVGLPQPRRRPLDRAAADRSRFLQRLAAAAQL